MSEISDRLMAVSLALREIKTSLKLSEKETELKKLEAASTDPDFWSDQEKARGVMQRIGDLNETLSKIKGFEEEVEILRELTADGQEHADLAGEVASLEARLTKFKVLSYLGGKYDAKNAIVGIHAGQGGTEAMDWTSMLLRMYLRFCERRGWKLEVVDETPGEEAGYKSVTFRVSGAYAYGYLKGEAGTHRLVRQSPFNADKLRQTSFALVEVLPEFGEEDEAEIDVKEEDLEWQFFRSGGHGGQNVNKVSTAVRLKHLPTGVVVTAQNERFQEQNRKIALNLLRSKLWLLEEEKRAKEVKSLKGGKTQASWGTQIRSYVLHPYKMVKDLRTGVETGNTEAVLDGDLDEFVEAELKLTTTGGIVGE